MVLKDMSSAYAILKIFAEATRAILYCMESDFDKTATVKSNLSDTVGRLQDVLENMEC